MIKKSIMKIKIISIFLLLILPVVTHSNTIGFMSDGDDNTGPHATELMTKDIDELIDQLPNGWELETINFLGDISYGDNNTVDAVKAWKDSIASNIPLFLVIGNHETETTDDVLFHRSYFENYPKLNLKSADSVVQATSTNYSYNVGDTHVSVINQYVTDVNDFGGDGNIHDDVFEWLKEDIRTATTTHKIVLAHEPMYPFGRHLGVSLDKYPETRDKLANLFASYGVVLFSAGHTHYSGLFENDYDWTTKRPSALGGGLWEMNTGVFGTKILESVSESFPTIGYFHSNSSNWGDYEILLVQANPNWNNPILTKKTHRDLGKQILINTWDGSGTGSTASGHFDMRYFVDYTDRVETNPDWFEFNSGKWWEPDFDAKSAGWTEGELSVGYDDNLSKWGWINTSINPDPAQTGENQVWGIFGRVDFEVSHPEDYSSLYLELDWEDSVHIWINGVEVFNNKSTIPAPTSGDGSEYFNKGTQNIDRVNVLGKEQRSPKYQRFNISEHLNLLHDGKNTLAYMSNNSAEDASRAYTSSDSALAIRLFMEGQKLSTYDEVVDSNPVQRKVDYVVDYLKNPIVMIGLFALIVAVLLVMRYFYVKHL